MADMQNKQIYYMVRNEVCWKSLKSYTLERISLYTESEWSVITL